MYMYSIYYYMCRNAIDTHWYFMEFLWPDRPVRVTNVRTPFDQFSFTSYLKVDHHLQAGCRGTFSFWINPPHCPFQTKKLPPCFSPYHFSTAQNNRNFRSSIHTFHIYQTCQQNLSFAYSISANSWKNLVESNEIFVELALHVAMTVSNPGLIVVRLAQRAQLWPSGLSINGWLSPGRGVLRISSDRYDRMGANIKTQKNP